MNEFSDEEMLQVTEERRSQPSSGRQPKCLMNLHCCDHIDFRGHLV